MKKIKNAERHTKLKEKMIMEMADLDEIIKILTIIECKVQKILQKKEQTECQSDCSTKIKLIIRKIEMLEETFKRFI